jgi:hypothetical protein
VTDRAGAELRKHLLGPPQLRVGAREALAEGHPGKLVPWAGHRLGRDRPERLELRLRLIAEALEVPEMTAPRC